MRHLLFILIISFLLTIPVSAADDFVAPTRLGIIGAMDIEIELYLEQLENQESTAIGGLTFYEGVLNGQPVVIVKSGVGKIYAASAATLLIHEFGVHAVIFSGVAGGVDPGLKVGDIVIADKLLQHDLGLRASDGFKWWDNEYAPNALLSQVAYEAAKITTFPIDMFEGIELQPKIVMGTIVTGDQFIMSDDYVAYLYEDFDAACTEMEGAAVAAVCEEFNVPYAVIRCLSDLADDVAVVDFDAFAPYAAKACSLIVIQMAGEASKIQEDLLSVNRAPTHNSPRAIICASIF
jgi:adenosylhomocysteine nucleosidase